MSMRRRYLSVVLVLLAGLVVTGAVFAGARRAALNDYREKLRYDVAIRADLVEDFLRGNLQHLDGLKRFVEGTERLDCARFRAFVQPILERPGVQAVEWIPMVPGARRAALEEAARREGLSGFRITEKTADGGLVPAAQRSVYYPVYYVEPVTGNEKALGFDLGSNSARLTAIRAAAAGARPQASARIVLVQEQGRQFGLLVFAPVYGPGGSLKGFALGVFRAGDMLESAIAPTASIALDTELHDLSAPVGERVVHRWPFPSGTEGHGLSLASLAFPLLGEDRPLDFAGRRWNLRVTATPHYREENAAIAHLAVLPVGILVTLLVALYLNGLLAHRDRAEELVTVRTAHLTEANSRLEQTVAELETAREGLHDQALELEREMAERQRAQEALQNKQEQLETLNDELERRIADEVEQSRAKDLMMVQQDKLASIGVLAAGVAHEINNPIGYIASNLTSLGRYGSAIAACQAAMDSLAAGDLTPEEFRAGRDEATRRFKLQHILDDIPHLIAESLEGAERIRQITADMKNFARAGEAGYCETDLHKCIASTVNIVYNELKYVAELDLDLDEVPPVVCNPQQINQVIANLLVNAAHAITGRGCIAIATRQQGDDVFISVQDSGCGIPPEVQSRIFDPFFTTKDVGKGTGLGLSISHDIVRKHGGDIILESEPGKGSTFTVRLPVAGPAV